MADDRPLKVEGHDGLMWIRGSGLCRDWNGIRYKLGMFGKNVGATQLSMNVATIPPGGVAAEHIHVDFEVMLYVLEGRVRHEYGEGLTERVDHQAGDFIFIAPGVPSPCRPTDIGSCRTSSAAAPPIASATTCRFPSR